MYRILSSLALAAISLPLASGQNQSTQPAPCADDAFRQFDFWLGEWEVISETNGAIAGFNTITSEESGCLILERWENVSGNTGQSYNFYNPATQTWRQVWVSQGAIIDYEGGLTETGSMKLEGTITYTATRQQADFTGEWTPNEDGTVTQHFEQFDAETDEWKPWFTGQYHRLESDSQD